VFAFIRKFSLVDFSVNHPWLVVIFVLAITAAFSTQFPKAQIDTNPKHMLPETSDVRVWNDEVDRTFGLYEDVLVLGIVNKRGVLNRETLGKIVRITDEILKTKGVAARDVSGFPTITNVSAEDGTLKVAPLMAEAPKDEAEIGALEKTLFENPLFVDHIISKDGKTTALYIPLEKGANGKEIADRIREITAKEKGEEEYYVAGDPVARDTFGADMFRLMAIFAPIAGFLMFAARYLMFRDAFLSIALMMDAMIAIVWSLGLLIGLGFPIHIMSSMAPVFLMAIATDSIHIFNEFYFRYRESGDKRAAIIDTMRTVGRPVRYTALATAAGFVVLIFMHIVPVRVFGGLIAFGTIALRILSFSFIPAMFVFAGEVKLKEASAGEDIGTGRTSRFLRGLAHIGVHRPKVVIATGVLLIVVAIVGISKIRINNNMIDWFKHGSEIRTADRVLNNALGGTSLGYIVAISDREDFIKTPGAMNYIKDLQRDLEKLPNVGKTFSVVDYVKRINRVLHGDDPQYNVVPDSKETIGQYLFLFSMSAKPSDLDSVVDYPFQRANIWVQLKTWDAKAMEDVIEAVDAYKSAHPIPMEFKPAGIAYFNLVWNSTVLNDMLKGFILALVAVLAILILNFRSFKCALVSFAPLVFTVLVIYGFLGFIGKDFDMPISVLSCLSLGMAVDFAIHFMGRFRLRLSEGGLEDRESIANALLWTAARPGKGIVRNATLFAAAFSVMLLAKLTPYITVGAFIVAMMTLSALMTMITMPALIILMRGWLPKGGSI